MQEARAWMMYQKIVIATINCYTVCSESIELSPQITQYCVAANSSNVESEPPATMMSLFCGEGRARPAASNSAGNPTEAILLFKEDLSFEPWLITDMINTRFVWSIQLALYELCGTGCRLWNKRCTCRKSHSRKGISQQFQPVFSVLLTVKRGRNNKRDIKSLKKFCHEKRTADNQQSFGVCLKEE